MKKLYSLLSLSLITFSVPALAQNGLAGETELNVSPNQSYQLEAFSADAVGIKCESCVFDNSYLLVGKDTVKLKADEHSDIIVALASLPSKQETVSFYSGSIKGQISFDFFSTGNIKIPERKTAALRTGDGDCTFDVIPTSVWRAGLAEPTWGTTYTKTENIAVHHGASANISTYEQAVTTIRQYYLLHRNTNGWGDIGYNYLIGPEGSIFQGREVKPGTSFTSDYIMGAHLCAMNSNSMGICIMGDFTNVLPSAKALESLYKLIKWKAKKDNIDINGTDLHPNTPTATKPQNRIPTIIGHREGPCATACPGNALYNYLFTSPTNPNRLIRTEVGNICEAPLGLTEEEMDYIVIVYPNPTNGNELKANFEYRTVAVHALDGKVIRPAAKKAGESISTTGLAPGIYFFHFETPDYGKVVRRVVVN
ncbi:N-acetylmuramoyl-L-alanine amidase [Rufibacter roseus]|uniref:N-acetylmuramoyl-L-alanine amidase n=1 Tax=Rufibacter roseus TaxID=1567108 RepID=A0ABW2DL07_9BACT|nr:N-acetylmuramoyl-L-alanine amidase [Rufibacter roseus]